MSTDPAGSPSLLTIALARELVAAWEAGVRVLAMTSALSLAAGLVARRTGVPDLAIATGFEVLDAVDPTSVMGGEATLGVDGAAHGPASDTFVALARGRILVAVTPAQLDARGAVNLSGVGGEPGRPKVALAGEPRAAGEQRRAVAGALRAGAAQPPGARARGGLRVRRAAAAGAVPAGC